MHRLSLAAHTVFADLQQRCLDASFDAHFPENGTFARRTSRGREYWYYQGYRSGDVEDGTPRRYAKYVGPVEDARITSRVQEFARTKEGRRERMNLVAGLVGMGLSRSDAFTGDLVEGLWKAGLFRLRGVLVGTAAFQTYAGLLGVRLPSAHTATGDVDVAQFHSISMHVDDTMPPVMGTLHEIDATFREVPHSSDSRASCAFVNSKGFRLEFLTPNRSKEEYQGRPARMPAFGGAGAQPLRFLDYLIHAPVPSVLLHRAGVPVTVPSPERYAIHKLIVASERRRTEASAIKARKDVAQAGFLIEALTLTSRSDELGLAWLEAWERGEGWQARLRDGAKRLDLRHLDLLDGAIWNTARDEQIDPGRIGFMGEYGRSSR